jgi:hypothetical protein
VHEKTKQCGDKEIEVGDDDVTEVERNARPDDRNRLGYETLLTTGFMPATSSVISR